VSYLGRYELAHVQPSVAMDAMGDDDVEYIGEEDGPASVRQMGVNEKLHPVSTHLHPGANPQASEILSPPLAPAPGMVVGNTSGGTATATRSKVEAVNASKAKGYTGNACGECGQLTMVRNGSCEKCDSCGSTSGCS
jgi:ribonucleoside-diphosphate reductase alpha chain